MLGRSRSLHILLAEDNSINQRLVIRLLEKLGHTVVVVNNGREAVEAHKAQRFDLVLTDIQMPEMGGIEATAHIREQERFSGSHTPIIAVTANGLNDDRKRCLAAGMDGYVTKPIQSAQLLNAIAEVSAAAFALS